MTAFRRTASNFALEHAVAWARQLRKPLLIVETLSCDQRWASDRHHAFVLDGMADNAAACRRADIRYYPYVERQPGEQIDLLVALGSQACAIIADDFPIESVSAGVRRVAGRVNVRLEEVDSNGLMPLRAADRVFPTASAFRRFLQRTLPDYLPEMPKPNPLARVGLPRAGGLPREITRRWPPAASRLLAADPTALAGLPITHTIGRVAIRGGTLSARKTLRQFLKHKLAGYAGNRNHPDLDGTSGLSPFLHFGHISVHEVSRELAKAEGWSPPAVADTTTGRREGWWGMSESAEGFLDELVTWREVGLNRCAHAEDCDRYDSLPDWAKATLAEHAADRREYVYALGQFEHGRTHDRLWNAAQAQLVCEGRMHNYLRMLWGKKILQWSADPREALAVMIELNNKYALDGQDPNSYSGIFWVLGRYDRPWGPQRPIFGKIRYMSSRNTARKLKLTEYLERYASEEGREQ
ncbi:MAG: deoxyribodipyrimidine photolyase [Pirellulales bacterium]|nr:deoxyribodipyrimidine photolyase [Pirellulales bacterium]